MPGIFTSLPCASISFTCGRTTWRIRRWSITTSVDRPVTSSLLGDRQALFTFSNFTRPANSVMMGRVSEVPVGQDGAGLDGLAFTARMAPCRHLVALAFSSVLVVDDDLAGTRNDDQLALAVDT